MNRLNGKVIIITGGNGLIGKSLIEKVRSDNAICINADLHNKTTADLTNIICDVTNDKSIDNTINSVIEKYGKIDGLVNNAYPRTEDWGEKFENISIESWRLNIDMQLNSVFVFCQKVLPHMASNKNGSIVNIGSIYGTVGPDFNVYNNTELTMPAAYSAIKGGVINFTRYLSSYYGKNNIRINCVSPGGIFNNQPIEFVKNYEKKVPMQRMGKPEDISPAVSFLLSDDSSYITGQNLIIDGGWTSI
jgi:NAD(P)-dependent dehydrogenase (short-subunit alcohol dehydrogenase family)